MYVCGEAVMVNSSTIESGEKVYNFLMCGKKFQYLRSLTTHEGIQHAFKLTPVKTPEVESTSAGTTSENRSEERTQNSNQGNSLTSEMESEKIILKCKKCSSVFSEELTMKNHFCVSTEGTSDTSSSFEEDINVINLLADHNYVSCKKGVSDHDPRIIRRSTKISIDGMFNNCTVKPEKMALTCDVCKVRFTNLDYFIVHELLHTGMEIKFCQVCLKICCSCKTVSSPGTSISETSSVSNSNESVQLSKSASFYRRLNLTPCPFCGRAFLGPGYLKKHITSCPSSDHSEIDICTICGNVFTNKEDYEGHLNFHANEHREVIRPTDPNSQTKWKPYVCTVCGNRYAVKNNLDIHVHTCHSKVSIGPTKNFLCEICGKNYKRADSLRQHRKKVHFPHKMRPRKPSVCKVCGKTFQYTYSLKEHIRKHTQKVAWLCDICGRGFYIKGSFRKHFKTHFPRVRQEKSHRCSFCEKAFPSLAALKLHLRIHTKEKPFSCHICGKRFTYKYVLDWHSYMHTNEKPFKCEVCNKCFSQKASLKLHGLSHTGEQPYECSICNKRFAYLGYMKTHYRTHTKEKAFLCTLCGQRFYDRGLFKKHSAAHDDAAAPK